MSAVNTENALEAVKRLSGILDRCENMGWDEAAATARQTIDFINQWLLDGGQEDLDRASSLTFTLESQVMEEVRKWQQ